LLAGKKTYTVKNLYNDAFNVRQLQKKTRAAAVAAVAAVDWCSVCAWAELRYRKFTDKGITDSVRLGCTGLNCFTDGREAAV
jgi:hypothetical protein